MPEPLEIASQTSDTSNFVINFYQGIKARILPEGRRILARVVAFVAVVALSIYIFSIRDQAEALAVYGYPGVFLFALLSSATVVLPAPGLFIVFSIGAVLNPISVGFAAGTGSALGELSGYLAGYSGQTVVENTQTYERVRNWMQTNRHLSSWAILFFAFLPVPIFDLAGIAAGALRIPVSRFLIWVWVGKLLKMTLFAYLGAASVDWIENLL